MVLLPTTLKASISEAYYLNTSQLSALSHSGSEGYYIMTSDYEPEIDADLYFLFPVNFTNNLWSLPSDVAPGGVGGVITDKFSFQISLPGQTWSSFLADNQIQPHTSPQNLDSGNTPNHTSGLPVYDLSVEHINAIVPSEELGNPPNCGQVCN